MISVAQLKAQERYDKKNTKQFVIKLNKKTDLDIITKLSDCENKQGFIKDSIRKSIKGNSKLLSLDAIKYLLLPVVKKFEIKSIYLFGSYARDNPTEKSDVDLLIDGGNYRGAFEYSNMISMMENILEKPVDVVLKTALDRDDSFENSIFKKNIERDKIMIYEED